MMRHKIFHRKLFSQPSNPVIYLFKRNFFPRVAKFSPDLIGEMMGTTKIKSIDDWKIFREAVLLHENNRGKYNEQNIDAMILGYCFTKKNRDLGSTYLNYLKQQNIKPNLATIGKYLKILYIVNEHNFSENGRKCNENDEALILKCYEDIRKDYPILDSITLDNAIQALSLTSQWRKCLDLLQEIKISAVPSSASYSAIVAAAFANNEEDLAWELLAETFMNDREPLSVAFSSYIATVKDQDKKHKLLKKLEKLFLFFQENDFKCGQDVVLSVSMVGEKYGLQHSFTSVSYQGICKNCHQKLYNFELDSSEFEDLKNNILQKVIVGRDLFVKTNPEELEKFSKFVSHMKKFDVVLDGLNVAYSAGPNQSPYDLSKLVSSVVSHFVQQNKKVLVLGRVHMNRWPNWDYIKHNSTVFLTQNISQDDPYLLYCALNSGKDTIIVTRDLMRGHRFLLKVPKHRILFNRWLSQRQYQLIRVDESRGPIFRYPPPFSIVAQKCSNGWHIPYVRDVPKEKNEFHRTWLCLKC